VRIVWVYGDFSATMYYGIFEQEEKTLPAQHAA
jgi:hypothetical protein